MTRRLPAILVVLAAGVIGLLAVIAVPGDGTADVGPVRHRIDLVANVVSISTDTGWSQDGGVTRGAARLTLDDRRVLTITEGTNAADYDLVGPCTDFAAPGACVLLADMLGDAVVWFALVAADPADPETRLTLPGIVDMQSNGDEGIFRNGWIMKLATPTKRRCESTDTPNLRDFITRFPDDKARSIVDLTSDSIIAVECVR